MYVSLQEGLYDLCRLRIEKDEEFKAQSARGNFDAVDDALFDEYKPATCATGRVGFAR